MDLNTVRTFIAVADSGQFQRAAADLGLSQQAVSKRVAALEEELGVGLFARTPRGAELTIDGQAFLPHARALLSAEERAAASVRPGTRALRVDVIGRRLCVAGLLRDFHSAHRQTPLDVVTLFDADTAIAALQAGTIDATFRSVRNGVPLPDGITAVPVYDEPLQLCTGRAHPLAHASTITPGELAGHRIWMPANAPGTEWAAYYDELAAAFGCTIETTGPDFGIEALLDTISQSTTLGTFVGEHTPRVWPMGYDLRRIVVHKPTPVYRHSLLWRADNPHPGLAALREYLVALEGLRPEDEVWVPDWARRAR
ncbi:MAG: LysR family transcriptional regulator [Streptomycetaceae bacterium]|nr:LysR family transcriptional regulator [Streptomycetaceae bacterium]NUS55392.1 LysR family transcriptional regulator [Streptomycetaceae bacterium]